MLNDSEIATIILVTSVFFIFLVIAIVLLLLRRRGERALKHETFHATTDANMRCPKCQAPMVPGYAYAQRGIAFRTVDEGAPGPFSFAWTKTLANTINMGFKMKLNSAWRCPHCNYLLIDHSTMIDPPKR